MQEDTAGAFEQRRCDVGDYLSAIHRQAVVLIILITPQLAVASDHDVGMVSTTVQISANAGAGQRGVQAHEKAILQVTFTIEVMIGTGDFPVQTKFIGRTFGQLERPPIAVSADRHAVVRGVAQAYAGCWVDFKNT